MTDGHQFLLIEGRLDQADVLFDALILSSNWRCSNRTFSMKSMLFGATKIEIKKINYNFYFCRLWTPITSKSLRSLSKLSYIQTSSLNFILLTRIWNLELNGRSNSTKIVAQRSSFWIVVQRK